MSYLVLLTFLFHYLIFSVASHSWMTEPQSTAPRECAIGGSVRSQTNHNMRTCAGPCEVGSHAFLLSSSPLDPAATYRRGQNVKIKYTRNNHGPGGFVRLTLVPLDKMMDKDVHSQNAFHYSCWGANPVIATDKDFEEDRFGFNIAGGDGALHDGPRQFLETNVTIPTVVPDGVYVLGWTWYGGIGGSFEGNRPERPFPNGFFGDYWSCSFVRVRGGPLRRRHNPVFINDMEHIWPRGCWSASNRLGECMIEPCMKLRGSFMVPYEFEGNRPKPLTRRQFTSPRCNRQRVRGFCNATPTPYPLDSILKEIVADGNSCRY